MRFEFDPAKSAANLAKHGINFLTAQELWERPTLAAPSTSSLEPRTANVGTVNGKHWTVITTQRGDVTRIISARRSRMEEVEAYEEKSS